MVSVDVPLGRVSIVFRSLTACLEPMKTTFLCWVGGLTHLVAWLQLLSLHIYGGGKIYILKNQEDLITFLKGYDVS